MFIILCLVSIHLYTAHLALRWPHKGCPFSLLRACKLLLGHQATASDVRTVPTFDNVIILIVTQLNRIASTHLSYTRSELS